MLKAGCSSCPCRVDEQRPTVHGRFVGIGVLTGLVLLPGLLPCRGHETGEGH